MFAFTIIMIVIFSFFDLAILIGIFKERDAETILSALIFFLILSLTLIYAVSVYLSVF